MSAKRKQVVLIVDDDPDYLLHERVQLEALGYQVREAHGAAAAEQSVGESLPDAVVVDLMMEEPDSGFSLCWRLKRKYPGLPVLIVTAVTAETGIEFDSATREERNWIKADALLSKPVRGEQLQRELKRLIKE